MTEPARNECDDHEIDQHLTLAEVVERLRLSRPTVIRLCQSGEFDAWQIGRRWRISAPSISAYLKRRRAAARNRRSAA